VANRWNIPKDVEELVKKRDQKCVYCGILFKTTDNQKGTRSTWEHIINDISIKGPENIVFCCGSCNASKGNKNLQDWLGSKYCITNGITKDSVAAVVQKHLE
jgi:hypothetical protein